MSKSNPYGWYTGPKPFRHIFDPTIKQALGMGFTTERLAQAAAEFAQPEISKYRKTAERLNEEVDFVRDALSSELGIEGDVDKNLTIEDKIVHARELIVNLADKRENLEGEIIAFRREARRIENELSSSTRLFEQMNDRYMELGAQEEEKSDRLKQVSETLAHREDALNESIAKSKRYEAELEARQSELSETLLKLENTRKDFDYLSKLNVNLSGDKTRLEREIADATKEKGKLKDTLTGLREKIRLAEATLQRLPQNIKEVYEIAKEEVETGEVIDKNLEKYVEYELALSKRNDLETKMSAFKVGSGNSIKQGIYMREADGEVREIRPDELYEYAKMNYKIADDRGAYDRGKPYVRSTAINAVKSDPRAYFGNGSFEKIDGKKKGVRLYRIERFITVKDFVDGEARVPTIPPGYKDWKDKEKEQKISNINIERT